MPGKRERGLPPAKRILVPREGAHDRTRATSFIERSASRSLATSSEVTGVHRGRSAASCERSSRAPEGAPCAAAASTARIGNPPTGTSRSVKATKRAFLPMLRAVVDERDPSFNRTFDEPCARRIGGASKCRLERVARSWRCPVGRDERPRWEPRAARAPCRLTVPRGRRLSPPSGTPALRTPPSRSGPMR